MTIPRRGKEITPRRFRRNCGAFCIPENGAEQDQYPSSRGRKAVSSGHTLMETRTITLQST